MSDERKDFSALRKLNSQTQRAGFFTRRTPGSGIEVSINNGDSVAARRLIEHVEKELAKRQAAQRGDVSRS
jgi:hypothetical protein